MGIIVTSFTSVENLLYPVNSIESVTLRPSNKLLFLLESNDKTLGNHKFSANRVCSKTKIGASVIVDVVLSFSRFPFLAMLAGRASTRTITFSDKSIHIAPLSFAAVLSSSVVGTNESCGRNSTISVSRPRKFSRRAFSNEFARKKICGLSQNPLPLCADSLLMRSEYHTPFSAVAPV